MPLTQNWYGSSVRKTTRSESSGRRIWRPATRAVVVAQEERRLVGQGVEPLDRVVELRRRAAREAARGQIAAAAVDVLPTEPPVDGNPLLDYTGDNLMVTPHIAWATREARQNAVDELTANVAAFLRGEERNRVV